MGMVTPQQGQTPRELPPPASPERGWSGPCVLGHGHALVPPPRGCPLPAPCHPWWPCKAAAASPFRLPPAPWGTPARLGSVPSPSSFLPQPAGPRCVLGAGQTWGCWCHPCLQAVPRATPAMYLLVSSGPEDGQDEDSGDRGSQVAGDSLDVHVELATAGALQDGDPHHAEGHQHHRDHPVSGSEVLQVTFLSPPCICSISAAVEDTQNRGSGPSAGPSAAWGCRCVTHRW